jgi:hypothetical protein
LQTCAFHDSNIADQSRSRLCGSFTTVQKLASVNKLILLSISPHLVESNRQGE